MIMFADRRSAMRLGNGTPVDTLQAIQFCYKSAISVMQCGLKRELTQHMQTGPHTTRHSGLCTYWPPGEGSCF